MSCRPRRSDRLPGVPAVEASARDRTARISYDPPATGPEAIVDALNVAGYPPGKPAADDTRTDKPAWTTASRITGTIETDLAMSGDHRKY